MYVIVAGGGHMGTHLVARLVAEGHDVAVIDIDPAVTQRIFAEQGVVVFAGSATDLDILEQAGIKRADVAVAMTGRDSDNLSFCLLARYFGVPRVLARMLNPQYEVPYRLVGATKIHSEADILVNSFLTSIQYPEVGALMPLAKGELVVAELRIPEGAEVAGKDIAAIVRSPGFPGHTVFIGVETDEGVAVADGKTVVASGTRVILAAQRAEMAEVVRCLTAIEGSAAPAADVTAAVEALRAVSFLAGLSSQDLTELARSATLEDRRRGDVVYRRGDRSDRLYVLRKGVAAVEHREGRTLLRPPAFFGERTALTGHARSRTITIAEDAQLVAVEGAALRSLILRNPFAAVEVAKLLSDKPGT